MKFIQFLWIRRASCDVEERWIKNLFFFNDCSILLFHLFIMGQKALSRPATAEPATSGVTPSSSILRKQRVKVPAETLAQIKTVNFLPTTENIKKQIGIQCYFFLESSKQELSIGESEEPTDYSLRCTVETPNISQLFSGISDYVWSTDLVRIRRMSLASAINLSNAPLNFQLKGVQCLGSNHDKCVCDDKTPSLTIHVPSYKNEILNLPIYDASRKDPDRYYCARTLDMTVCWTLAQGSSPHQLIQWMLNEKKYLICVSMMLDIVYNITPNPEYVCNVIDL